MIRQTKLQRKNQDRIQAWLSNSEFKENSRSEPAVPNLSREQVLEEYIPPGYEHLGAFFTPPKMADEVRDCLDEFGVTYGGSTILDLGAGIGGLINPYYEFAEKIIAVEIVYNFTQLGGRLFPEATWVTSDIADFYPNAGKYPKPDLCVMNPPYNISPNKEELRILTGLKTGKTEQMFLYLAAKICAPGAYIAILAPSSLFKLGDKTSDRLATMLEYQHSWPIKSQFEYTHINVLLWLFQVKDVIVPGAPIVGKWPVRVTAEVFESMASFTGDLPVSSQDAVDSYHAAGCQDAARWVRANRTQYDKLYFYGFVLQETLDNRNT
jgi:hypothetical protein